MKKIELTKLERDMLVLKGSIILDREGFLISITQADNGDIYTTLIDNIDRTFIKEQVK